MYYQFNYRVWIKEEKMMTKLKGHHLLNFEVSYPSFERKFFKAGEIVLMQATGQLDSNAKMIYAGDMLYSKGGEIYLVEVVRGGFRAHGCYGNLKELTDRDFCESCNIIGNIFENKDKVKKEVHKTWGTTHII